MLDVGEAAPEFALPNHRGDTVRRSDFAGDPLVVYFFPRANTEGCTTEAREFSERHDAFAERGITVVGISDDPVDDLAAFKAEHALDVELLSDEHGEVATIFDSFGEKQLYGNTFEGIYRNTYAIDGDGVVIGTFEDVSPAGHAEAVLEWFAARQAAASADD